MSKYQTNWYKPITVAIGLLIFLGGGGAFVGIKTVIDLQPIYAVTMPTSSIPLGGVVSINGQKFAKISSEGEFMALQPVARTMQSFTTANCASYPTPTATNYTPVGKLVDERDGKSYEIRKFADGKCWMVDNLMYGGTTDACAAKTSFNGCGNGSTATNCGGTGASKSGSAWGYGDCRDPRAGGVAPCTAGSTTCGYTYNWQAALQLSSAYYGVNVSYPGGAAPTATANFVQGICPTGWHIPSGGVKTGEIAVLDIANGGTGADQASCTAVYCNFWQPNNAFKGVYTGAWHSTYGLQNRGLSGVVWASTQYSSLYAHNLSFRASAVYPGTSTQNYKAFGFAVRCIKD